jgi:hypothetical protein
VTVACPACRRVYEPGVEPDPCLGQLPGVRGACCGHGDPAGAYIGFESGTVIRGFTKVERYPAPPPQEVPL